MLRGVEVWTCWSFRVINLDQSQLKASLRGRKAAIASFCDVAISFSLAQIQEILRTPDSYRDQEDINAVCCCIGFSCPPLGGVGGGCLNN